MIFSSDRLLSALLLLLASSSRAFVVHHSSSAFVSTASTSFRLAAADAKNASEVSHDNVEDYRNQMGILRDRDAGEDATPHDMDVVMKFGGSSLADASRIEHVAQLIKDQRALGFRPRAIVCSAMGKTTNNLLSAGDFALEGRVNVDAIRTLHTATIDEFGMTENVRNDVMGLLQECEDMLNGVRMIQELSPKSLDQLVSYGERCSVRLVAARLNQIGVPAQAFDAWEVGMFTDSEFGDARLLVPNSEDAIRERFDRVDPNVVAVVTGFIGHDPKGRITTLGRGGSDLTATALGAGIGVDEIQVWKDVDGILTADPRMIPVAVPVPDVSYDEASELAYFGAQVLHPIAMQPARKNNIPVRVKNSYNPIAVGTIIQNEKLTERLVTAITYKDKVKLMDIQSTQMLGAYGFLAKVFGEFEQHKLSVDVLASSEVSVSLTLDKKQGSSEIAGLMKGLESCAQVSLVENKSILTLIADVARSSEVLATVFRVFSTQGIKVEMMSQGASKVNISFILDSKDLNEAVFHLHRCFFEDRCVVEKDDTFSHSEAVDASQ